LRRRARDGGGHLGDVLVDVRDEQRRLRGDRPERAQRVAGLGRNGNACGRASRLERRDQLLEPGLFGDRLALTARAVRTTRSSRRSACSRSARMKLRLDRLDVV